MRYISVQLKSFQLNQNIFLCQLLIEVVVAVVVVVVIAVVVVVVILIVLAVVAVLPSSHTAVTSK